MLVLKWIFCSFFLYLFINKYLGYKKNFFLVCRKHRKINYRDKKLSNLPINLDILSSTMGFSSIDSSYFSLSDGSWNTYAPGVDGDDTKSKHTNSKSSCTIFWPFSDLRDPTPRDEIPSVTPFMSNIAAWSPLVLTIPDFFHPGDSSNFILPMSILPSHHVSVITCDTLSKSINE